MADAGPHREIWQRDCEAAMQYERCAVPFLLGPWTADLIESVTPRPGERVLDVACGTGLVARQTARYVGAAGQVAGLDINPEMLAVARAIPLTDSAPIQWREGEAGALPFPKAAFDVVFCHQGLQFFPNPIAALREIYRVLVPGGRVALAVWSGIERNPYFFALAQALDRRVWAEAARQMRSSFVLGDPHELELLMTQAGFSNATVKPVLKSLRLPPPAAFVPAHLAGTSLAGVVAALDEGARAELIADVTGALKTYLQGDGMALPFEIQVAFGYS